MRSTNDETQNRLYGTDPHDVTFAHFTASFHTPE
jgi:hypothetical protein